MNWYFIAFLSGLGVTLRNIFYKVGSEKIDAAFAAVYYISLRLYDQQPFFASANIRGILFAVIAGASLAGANICLSYSYKAGGLTSTVGILQTGAAIALTVLICITLFYEHVRPLQILGIITATTGISMIIRR